MPTLFLREPHGMWKAIHPGATPTTLLGPESPVEPAAPVDSSACVLTRWRGHAEWAVVVPPATRVIVNETPVTTGLRLLCHRDALRVAGGPPVFFSTEEPARVEPFEGAAEPLHCPRCRTEIVAGDAVVRCPACGLLHHQREERPCWTYAPTCAGCDQPTDPQAGPQWSPEDL